MVVYHTHLPRVTMQAEIDAEGIIAARYKSTEVKKEVNLQFDIGNLLASDLSNIDTAALKYVRKPRFFLCYTLDVCGNLVSSVAEPTAMSI